MRIHLPNSAFLGNIDPFLRSFDNSNLKELIITANKKWISIHPVVLAMIATLGESLELKKIECEKLEATSKHYLERMKLFEFLDIESGIKINKHESSGRFIPLTQIKTSEELSDFIREMVPLLHISPQQAEPIKYIISELVRNVLEHAKSKSGAILCAQYYIKSNTIRIGIVDGGIGIKKSINQSYSAETDLDAIKLALIPGITGTTRNVGGTEFNAGAGLFFIKSIATANKDFFMIYSGNGMYKLLKRSSEKIRLNADPFRDKHSRDDNYPYWQGTVLGIDISLENTAKFSILLDLIRKAYKKGIKERKKVQYKGARFI